MTKQPAEWSWRVPARGPQHLHVHRRRRHIYLRRGRRNGRRPVGLFPRTSRSLQTTVWSTCSGDGPAPEVETATRLVALSEATGKKLWEETTLGGSGGGPRHGTSGYSLVDHATQDLVVGYKVVRDESEQEVAFARTVGGQLVRGSHCRKALHTARDYHRALATVVFVQQEGGCHGIFSFWPSLYRSVKTTSTTNTGRSGPPTGGDPSWRNLRRPRLPGTGAWGSDSIALVEPTMEEARNISYPVSRSRILSRRAKPAAVATQSTASAFLRCKPRDLQLGD